MIAFSGVRSSWDMLARNSDLCRLASSSSAYTLRSSSFIRLTLAANAPSSSRFSTSTRPSKSPDAIAASRPLMLWIGPTSDHDRMNPSNRASTRAPAATPMNKARELANELSFRSISSSTSARVPSARSAAFFLRSLESLSTSRLGRGPSSVVRGSPAVEGDELFVQLQPQSRGRFP